MYIFFRIVQYWLHSSRHVCVRNLCTTVCIVHTLLPSVMQIKVNKVCLTK